MISEWVNWRGLVPVLNELVLLLLRVPAGGRGVIFNFACTLCACPYFSDLYFCLYIPWVFWIFPEARTIKKTGVMDDVITRDKTEYLVINFMKSWMG